MKSLVLGFGDESSLLFYGVVIVISWRKLCSQASGNRRALKLLQHPFSLGKNSMYFRQCGEEYKSEIIVDKDGVASCKLQHNENIKKKRKKKKRIYWWVAVQFPY